MMHAAAMNTELMPNRNGRPHWLFMVTVLWGAMIPWLSNHLPMVDIAQHAAQIGLWRDLLLGRSVWEEYFRINLFTPYLLGYGIALPLSFLIGISASLKLMLSVAYIAFVYLCIRLRQQFNADPRLDWLYAITFFGYAYKWGFFTFLVAAPVGLLFILYASQYAQGPTMRQATKLFITGVALLAFHGLVSVYAVGAGIGMHLLRNLRDRGMWRSLWPYLLLIAICGVYFLVNKKFSADMPTNLDSVIKWDYGFDRILKAIVYLTTPNADLASMLIPIGISFIMLTAPWLMGLKINWRNPTPLVPLALTLFILGFVPNYAFSTALLYQRFTLFLLPAYAWTFQEKSSIDGSVSKARWQKLMVLMLMLSTWLYLGLHTVRTIRFDQESAGIDRIISQLKPQQRALTMALDPSSEADSSINIYAHYPAWYQAEKGGLVDFNFAWFPPQIVRYRSDHLPAIEPGFEWNVHKFNWQLHRADEFHYFFVRYSEPPISNIFHGAPCPPQLVAESGLWKIYERLPCTP